MLQYDCFQSDKLMNSFPLHLSSKAALWSSAGHCRAEQWSRLSARGSDPFTSSLALCWNPNWNTICNSPAISVWTTHLKQIQLLWVICRYRWCNRTNCSVNYCMMDTQLSHFVWKNEQQPAILWKCRWTTMPEDFFKSTKWWKTTVSAHSGDEGFNVFPTVHFSQQVDPAWQQPEVELSSTIMIWRSKGSHTTCHLLSKPPLTRLSTLLISWDEWCADKVTVHSHFRLSTNVCQFGCVSKNPLNFRDAL